MEVINQFTRINQRIDPDNKVKYFKKRSVNVALVEEVDWETVRPLRAGAIIYTFFEGQLMFALGVDSKSQELTDFSGGVQYRRDRNAVTGGLRELQEESLGAFGNISQEEIKKSIVVYSEDSIPEGRKDIRGMMIMFIYRPIDIFQCCFAFDVYAESHTAHTPLEVFDIVWVTSDEFITGIKTRVCTAFGKKRILYNRVANLLSQAPEFISQLKIPQSPRSFVTG